MGNQSRQTQEDNYQQAMGGQQPSKAAAKELDGKKSKTPHSSGDRNANEGVRDEGFERPARR